jgi:preprotein translocase subunit SecY
MQDAGAGIGGMLNMFTGGAISRMGIFALGIMPYISASIIVQLMAAMVPSLQQLKKEGEQGRKKLNQYTRYGTVFLAVFQAWGIAVSIEAGGLAHDPGLFFKAACVITLVGGTMFLMWLGEQITARGIGNGISLIIFVGIVAEIPAALAQFFSQGRSGALSPAVIIGVIVMVIAVIAFVVFMERALRKIHIQYPRRQVGMKIYDGGSSHLPVKVNPAGVIPAIFASSSAAVSVVLYRHDRVLHLFLHLQRGLQGRGCGREPAEPERVHSGHPPRQEDRGLSGICRYPPDGARLGVSGRRLPSA